MKKSKPFPQTLFVSRPEEGTEDEFLRAEEAAQNLIVPDEGEEVRAAEYRLVRLITVKRRVTIAVIPDTTK